MGMGVLHASKPNSEPLVGGALREIDGPVRP
jgi:hypothetical protein